MSTDASAQDVFDDETNPVADALKALDMTEVKQLETIYNDCMKPYPTLIGKAASKRDREDRKLRDSNLVYGEIDFASFALTVEKIRKVYGKPNVGYSGPTGMLQEEFGGTFYDIGSGIGKPVIAAAILHNFALACGIEILEGLHSLSNEIMDSYSLNGRDKIPRPTDTNIQLLQGDILDMKFVDWRDADLVFANSTCFDEVFMSKIADIAAGLKKGAFFVTITKRLPSADFEILEHELHTMSWGEATIYIAQKTNDSRDVFAGNEAAPST